MQDQTKSLAEQAWSVYDAACKEAKTIDDIRGIFIKAVESVFVNPKSENSARIEDYKPTFEGASEEAKDTVLKIYRAMDRRIAESVIGTLAEVPYTLQKGELKIEDLPPNSLELQKLVFGVVARKKLEGILASALAGRL